MTKRDRKIAFECRVVETEGATLEIVMSDSPGPPLCAVHPFISPRGNTIDSLNQSSYIGALAASAQLVVVNPRGSGRSSPIRRKDDLRLHRLAADLEDVRRALGITKWLVAGGSSGANVALLYALLYGQALQGLMLFSTGPNGAAVLDNPQSLASPHHPQHAGLAGNAPLQVAPSALGPPGTEWRQIHPDVWCLCGRDGPRLMLSRNRRSPPPIRQRAALEDFATFDVARQLAQIRAPTLIVCGRRDTLIPLCECQRLTVIPHAELVVLDQSGHGLDEIHAFQRVVRRFIAGQALM